jgi:hypothetical protein
MNEKVVQLVPQSEADSQKIAAMVGKLAQRCEQNRIRSFLYAYIDADGDTVYGVSGNMTLKEMSMAVHFLQSELMGLLAAQPHETLSR